MKIPFAARAVCLASLFAIACGSPEEVAPGTLEAPVPPSDFRCEPMAAGAKASPPAPVIEGGGVAATGLSAAPLCPSGQVPRAVSNPLPLHHRAPRLALALPGGDRPVTASADTYYYAGVMKPTAGIGDQRGVGSLIQIANTAVANWEDQITGEMALVQGANTSLVEVGYRKWKTTYPTLLLGHWVGGVFQHVTGWVQTHPTYYPGMDLTAYVGLKVRFYILYSNGDWWVWFNDGWMGYFPGSRWGGTFTSGSMAHWYGEVFDYGSRVPPLTDMGNGLFGSNPAASAMDDMCLHGDALCYLISGAWTSVTNAAYYELYYPGASSLRYGGNGGG